MIAQYFDIIVLLLVVVVIYQRLKGLLGTRPEGTESRKISDEDAAKIFDIIMKDAQKEIEAEKTENPTEPKAPEEAVNLTEEEKIFRRIPGFDKETFLNGAKRAFEIILEAFNKGDTETLEMLVSKNLLKKFQATKPKFKKPKSPKTTLPPLRSNLSLSRSICLKMPKAASLKATSNTYKASPMSGLLKNP